LAARSNFYLRASPTQLKIAVNKLAEKEKGTLGCLFCFYQPPPAGVSANYGSWTACLSLILICFDPIASNLAPQIPPHCRLCLRTIGHNQSLLKRA
jgi:hypothetical protein